MIGTALQDLENAHALKADGCSKSDIKKIEDGIAASNTSAKMLSTLLDSVPAAVDRFWSLKVSVFSLNYIFILII